MNSTTMSPDRDSRTVSRLQLCVAVFSMLLCGVTWPLWWPVEVYPTIPWFSGLLSVPMSIDRGLAIGWVVSSLGIAIWSMKPPTCLAGRAWFRGVWLVCLAGSVLLDQQRFQVWAWEYFWLTLFFHFASPCVALKCSRVLVVGIYAYSAISKLDAGFVETQGPWLWQGLQRSIGAHETAWATPSSAAMLTFPLGELLVAGLLSVPRSRRWGIAGSWTMHLILLLTLGPLGWDQKPGVLLWNLFFLISVPLLFGNWSDIEKNEDRLLPAPGRRTVMSVVHHAWQEVSAGGRVSLAAVAVLSLWPATEGLGVCDHWPAWAVYSSRPEIVTIDIVDWEVSRLPESLLPHVGPPEPLSDWRPISIDRWSFEQGRGPTYPQSRYRLAIARHLESVYHVHLRIREESTPQRTTGQRDTREIFQVAEDCDRRFWMNTRTRVPTPATPVSRGDQLIAITAQLAVACYAFAIWLSSRSPWGARPTRTVAGFWTVGLVMLVLHVTCAFHFLHHWSHAAALRHTAQRTAAVTGWDWSGGLYINYAFLLFWAADVVRVWREALGGAPLASLRWRQFVQGVFLFMMFNATVVFGPWHWTVTSVVFAWAWWSGNKSASLSGECPA